MFRRRPPIAPAVAATPRPPVMPIRFLDEEPPVAPSPAPKPAPTPEVAAPRPARPRREFPIGVVAFLGVVGTGLYLAGASPFHRVEAVDKLVKSFDVPITPKVIVETFNGPIRVERGVGSKVDVEVVKTANGADNAAAQAALAGIDVQITRDGDTVRVVARRPAGASTSMWSLGTSVTLRVPAATAATLQTGNGEVKVEGVEGPVKAHSSNGAIDLKGGTGPLDLRTSNGRVSCEATDAVVAAETSNGAIEFRGSLAAGGSSFETSNGAVRIKLPPDAAFALDAKTSNGKVEAADFGLRPGKGPRSKHLVATVGDDPKVRLKIRTSNGAVKVEED